MPPEYREVDGGRRLIGRETARPDMLLRFGFTDELAETIEILIGDAPEGWHPVRQTAIRTPRKPDGRSGGNRWSVTVVFERANARAEDRE